MDCDNLWNKWGKCKVCYDLNPDLTVEQVLKSDEDFDK